MLETIFSIFMKNLKKVIQMLLSTFTYVKNNFLYFYEEF